MARTYSSSVSSTFVIASWVTPISSSSTIASEASFIRSVSLLFDSPRCDDTDIMRGCSVREHTSSEWWLNSPFDILNIGAEFVSRLNFRFRRMITNREIKATVTIPTITPEIMPDFLLDVWPLHVSISLLAPTYWHFTPRSFIEATNADTALPNPWRKAFPDKGKLSWIVLKFSSLLSLLMSGNTTWAKI